MISYNQLSKVSRVSLTKRLILETITSEQIYLRYLGYWPDINKKYLSPFKEESNPSFGFYYKNNELKFKCFSSGKGGDCIDLLCYLYNIDYKESKRIIYNDLCTSKVNLPIPSTRKVEKKREVLDLVLKDWEEHELNYWKQFKISRNTLDIFNIKPVKEVYRDNNLYWTTLIDNPIFRYRFGDKVKCYRPLASSKKDKWYTNTTSKDIQGFNQLEYKSNIVFITSSMKDVMCLYELGYEAIAPQAEGNHLNSKMINYLEDKYDNIILLYNSDSAGIKCTNIAIEEYSNLKHIYIPIEISKDPSDCIKNIGKSKTKKLIDKLLNQI